MIKLSIVIPVYLQENVEFLEKTLDEFQKYSPKILNVIELVIVDDCSPIDIQPSIEKYNMNMKFIKIKTDIAWNQPGARNVGACHASGYKLIISDLDNFIPEDTLKFLLDMTYDDKTVYRFKRRYFDTKQDIGNTVSRTKASMVKPLYLSVNGHDERYSGYYGCEGQHFIEVIRSNGGKQVVLDKYMEDMGYGRNKTKYHSLNRSQEHNLKLYTNIKGTVGELFLNFEWEIVKDYKYRSSKDIKIKMSEKENTTVEETPSNIEEKKYIGFYDNIIRSESTTQLPIPAELLYIEDEKGPVSVLCSEIDPDYVYNEEDSFIVTGKLIKDYILINKESVQFILHTYFVKYEPIIQVMLSNDESEKWLKRCDKCWDIDKERSSNYPESIRIASFSNLYQPVHNSCIPINIKQTEWAWPMLKRIHDKNYKSVCDVYTGIGHITHHLSRMGKDVYGLTSNGWKSIYYPEKINDVCELDVRYYNVNYCNTIFHKKFDVFVDTGGILNHNRYRNPHVIRSFRRQCINELVVSIHQKLYDSYFEFAMNYIKFDYSDKIYHKNGQIVAYFGFFSE